MGETGPRARALVLSNAVAYILGFSTVFIILGIALGAAGALAGTADLVAGNRIWLVRLGGAMLIFLGLHQLQLVNVPFLARERRLSLGSPSAGNVTSSFVTGVSFGAGWSPCVGPILGAILTMAASQGDAVRASLLLTAYSGGLAIPFLAAALAFGSSPSVIQRLNRRLGLITSFSGAIMLGMGAIMLLGIYERFFAEMIRVAPWTPWEPRI